MNMMSSSSPDSTISSRNGNRREREENRSEPHSASSEGGAGDDSATRKKLRLTKEQAELLEETFKYQNTLDQSQKVALASQLNLQTRQVEVWFQNRRARTKSKKTEVDCAYLKRMYQDLTEENNRLRNEVANLKALENSPETTPPITLSKCPECERVSTGTSAQHHVSASGPLDQTTSKANHWLFGTLSGDEPSSSTISTMARGAKV